MIPENAVADWYLYLHVRGDLVKPLNMDMFRVC